MEKSQTEPIKHQLYVHNLSANTKAVHLAELFRKQTIQIVRVDIIRFKCHRAKLYGLVTLPDDSQMQKCISIFDKAICNGNVIRVSRQSPARRRNKCSKPETDFPVSTGPETSAPDPSTQETPISNSKITENFSEQISNLYDIYNGAKAIELNSFPKDTLTEQLGSPQTTTFITTNENLLTKQLQPIILSNGMLQCPICLITIAQIDTYKKHINWWHKNNVKTNNDVQPVSPRVSREPLLTYIRCTQCSCELSSQNYYEHLHRVHGVLLSSY